MECAQSSAFHGGFCFADQTWEVQMSRPEWLSLPDAAVKARASWAVTWRAVLTGAVEARRVRGRWFIRADSLEDWIAARAQAAHSTREPAPAT